MKIFLKYYYDIDDLVIINKGEYFQIIDKEQVYLLYEVENANEIYIINEIIKKNHLTNYFYKIKKTKNNMLTIKHNNKSYVLIEYNENSKNTIERTLETLKKINSKINNPIYNCINRNNWYFLWSNKTDYYIYNNKISSNEYLKEMKDYYIGMAENAIQYVKDAMEHHKNTQVYISYKRIQNTMFMNPLNIVLDVYERDISEYLRYLYFNGQYSEKIIDNVLDKIKQNEISTELIFARLIYPTYYFDACEKNIQDLKMSNNMKLIYNNIENYEKFLIQVYSKLNNIKKTKKIDWLN